MKIKREIYICSVTVPAPISGHELPESQMRTSDRVYTASVSDLEICRSFQAPTWAPSVQCSLHSSPRDPPPVGHIRSLLSFKHFNNILSQKIKPKVFATAGEALCDPGPGDLSVLICTTLPLITRFTLLCLQGVHPVCSSPQCLCSPSLSWASVQMSPPQRSLP